LSREIFGNIAGLKPSILRSLEKLYRRKVPPQSIITPELAQELAYLSYQINRQVGLLINRKGDVDFVVVGSYNRIEIPELHGYRDHQARLKGLRFIHTHLVKKDQSSGLDQDDLIDLAFLRLDLIGAQEVYEDGRGGRIHIAHILPSQEFYSASLDDEAKRLFYFFKPVYPWDLRENFQELIRNLEEEFERVSGAQALHEKEDRAILIFVREPGDIDWENKLAELKELARTAGVKVVGEVVQRRAQIDPRYVIGKGKLLEVLIECLRKRANLLIFDRELTPSQVRALNEATDLRVIDRTQLILDIFAQRAKSREGKIQVEVAQLRYALPRLRAKDDAFSRLTGGIGGRGPGETKLEVDRHRIRDRIARLKQELESISEERALRRKRRKKLNLKVVALIGYTNAGKTTLLNRLSHSDYLAEDKLFATLDPVTKAVRTPSGKVFLLTDTVGFIRELPEELKKAFKATLEELYSADLLLHIVDASSPDLENQIKSVEAVLDEMELRHIPRIVAFNKIDLLEDLDPFQQATVKSFMEESDGVPISALTGFNVELLLKRIEENLFVPEAVFSPYFEVDQATAPQDYRAS